MCVSPIKIYNKSRRISLNSFVPSYYMVPCGKCCDCVSMKQSEWLFRIRNEFDNCISDGGCVLFDTLTYAPESVPYLSHFDHRIFYTYWDRFCFNSKHCQDFFKRLRHHFDFRYFLVSEYGTHPYYSHRPHYHVLFFLPKGVDPLTASVAIADEWTYGRTDGVGRSDGFVYKGSLYVLQKRVFRESSPRLNNIIRYVSKYVTKSFVEDDKLRNRIHLLMVTLHGDDYRDSLRYRLESQLLYRHVAQFHLQSLHFGDVSEFVKWKSIQSDSFVVQTSDGPKSLPLFRSFRRRWFYDKNVWKGFEYWTLNADGMDYQLRKFDKIVNNQALRFNAAAHSSPAVRSMMDSVGVSYQVLSEYYVGASGRIGKYSGESPRQMFIDSLAPDLSDCVFNVSSIYDKWRFGHNGWCPDYVPMCQYSKDIALGHKHFDGFESASTIFPYSQLPDVISYKPYDDIIDAILSLEAWYGQIKQSDADRRRIENYRLKKAGLTNYSLV